MWIMIKSDGGINRSESWLKTDHISAMKVEYGQEQDSRGPVVIRLTCQVGDSVFRVTHQCAITEILSATLDQS